MQEAVRQEFTSVVNQPDHCIRLDRAALLIAKATQADVDVEHYVQMLDLLSEHAALRIRDLEEPPEIILSLNRYLFEDEKFTGNTETYYDPRNSFLNEVLERRTGVPVSLSLLYMELGRRLNFRIDGVGLPGHFIVKHPGPRGDILIDPFHKGQILSEVDCEQRLRELYSNKIPFERRYLKSISRRRVLRRMINNLKAIYLHARDALSAIEMVELTLCMAPDDPEEIKARGLLYLQLECFGLAAADLEHYLELRPVEADRESVQAYLIKAKQRKATLN